MALQFISERKQAWHILLANDIKNTYENKTLHSFFRRPHSYYAAPILK